MSHEFNLCEAPIDGEVDRWGFTIKPSISDEECILRCIKNAPEGCDKKQVARLVQEWTLKVT